MPDEVTAAPLRPQKTGVSLSLWERVPFVWCFVPLWMASIALQVVLASHLRGYVGDQMIFVSWMQAVMRWGVAGAYQTASVNYPPVYLLVLGVYGSLMNFFHISVLPGGLSIKLPGIALDAAAMIAVYVVSKGVRPGWRLFVLALFCLNPAILYDTAVWGQVDILDSLLAVLSIVALKKRPGVAGGLFSLALLSKFQSIVILPVLAAYALQSLLSFRRYQKTLALALGVMLPLAAAGVWLGLQGGLLAMVDKAYVATTSEYPYLSLNAMNIWYYLFGISPQTADSTPIFAGLDYKLLGLALLALAALYVVYYVLASRVELMQRLLKAGTLIAFAFYMLPTEIHERYILMAVVFSLLVILFDKKWTLIALGLTLTAFFNLVAVDSFAVNPTSDMWMVYLNLILFAAMFALTYREFAVRTKTPPPDGPGGGDGE